MPAATLLAPLLALAGHCFSGDVAKDASDLHCFTSVYDGAHVRDVHRVKSGGRVVYQGETLYSVEHGAVVFTYLTSLGGIGRGTASLAPRVWRFTGTMRAGPSAAETPITTVWRWRGAQRYAVSGGPAPVTYRRVDR